MAVRFGLVLAAAVAGITGLVGERVAAQSETAPFPDSGQSIRRSIAPGERHVYRFSGPAGSYLDFHVQPNGADVAVAVRAKDAASELTASNDMATTFESEWVVAITDTAGEHHVIVTADRVDAKNAGYRLIVREVRPARAQDRASVEGLELLRAGTRTNAPRTRDAAMAALETFTRAAAAFRSSEHRYGEATALHNMASIQTNWNDRPAARENLQRALTLFQQIGTRLSQAHTVVGIGDLHFLEGERRQAADHHQRAIAIYRTEDDPAGLARALVRLGLALNFLGQKQNALDAYQEALDLARSIPDRSTESLAMLNTGQIHYQLGDWDRALEHYGQALALSRVTGDRGLEVSVLNNMGTVHAARGESRQAIALYEEALALRRGAKISGSEGAALSNLGWAYDALGERERAVDYFQKALVEWRTRADRAGEAATLNNLGRVQATIGDVAGGLANLELALEMRRAVADPGPQALTLYNIARVLREQGRLAEAEARLDEGLDIIERLRRSVTSPELRSTLLASVLEYYELAIDVLMTRHAGHPTDGHAARAWRVAERARARSLLEGLADARGEIQPRGDPALTASLAQQQDTLDARLEAQSGILRRKHSPEEAAAAARDVADAAREVRLLQRRIRADDPQYAALMEPEPPALEEVQRSLLDEETTLVELALGRRQSYAWVVTRSRMQPVVLAPRQDIEQQAVRLHAAAGANDEAGTRDAARALSRLLLAPILPHVSSRRIAIVADGALQTVPFSALPDPASPDGAPLIATREVTFAPSVATVAILRQPRPRSATLDVAVVADPVFDKGDPRVGRVTRSRAPAVPSATPSHRRSMHAFGRLVGSRREARGIADLVPAGRRFEAFDFAARREIVDEGRLGSARFVHFATHAVVDRERPDLSGLVLSLVDASGAPVNGYLRLHDIYNLRLSADLVVLSACQTALGQAIDGEGLIGLVRGFMHAGAPRVVATLWQVDDRASAELMQRFYRHMLGPAPLGPPAALRAAQREVSAMPGYRSPYYWAGFVLQGDWR